MNELKPVACRMKRLDETIFIDNERDAILFAEQGWAAESVYIIPDTQRVVSVEFLWFLWSLSMINYDEHTADTISAIIDNKVQP
jgi:hypothetical protein